MMDNYFYAPLDGEPGKRTNMILENSQYFLNDPTMAAKWHPYMAYIKKVCNNPARFWGPNATSFFIYELGRYFVADFDTFKAHYGNSWAITRETLQATNCKHILVDGGFEYFLSDDSKLLPTAYSSANFVGWTDGEKVYTDCSDISIDGKTLTPVFEGDVEIILSGESEVTVGQTIQLNLEINGPQSTILWTSDNEFVAKIDENGVVTGVVEGVVTITASVKGATATIEITVKGLENADKLDQVLSLLTSSIFI